MSATDRRSAITALLVPTYKQSLKSLSTWLDKAEEELLAKRLAPDMFPLATQIRFVCLQAQEAFYRLQAKEIPPELLELGEEGRDFGDGKTADTLVHAKARIKQAIAFLERVEDGALDGNSDSKLTLELPDGLAFDMTGEQYARDWALPQFYFHFVVAYSILRNAGVPLGKVDYVSHMSAYMRPLLPQQQPEE